MDKAATPIGKAQAALLRGAEQSPGWTGSPPGMLQDDSRDLSRWLASKPDAMMRAREAADQMQAPTCCPYCNAPIVGWSDSGPA